MAHVMSAWIRGPEPDRGAAGHSQLRWRHRLSGFRTGKLVSDKLAELEASIETVPAVEPAEAKKVSQQ